MFVVYLRKLSKTSWAIETDNDTLGAFSSIEDACDQLEKMGADSDELDLAIMQMAGLQHNRAQFDSTGKLIATDSVSPKETIGVA